MVCFILVCICLQSLTSTTSLLNHNVVCILSHSFYLDKSTLMVLFVRDNFNKFRHSTRLALILQVGKA